MLIEAVEVYGDTVSHGGTCEPVPPSPQLSLVDKTPAVSDKRGETVNYWVEKPTLTGVDAL
jgi:hypothetical protein